jgi:hypothetical protein
LLLRSMRPPRAVSRSRFNPWRHEVRTLICRVHFKLRPKGVSALITVRNPVLIRHSKRIVDLAIKNRLPSMYEGSHYVEAGGLMSYSANSAD